LNNDYDCFSDFDRRKRFEGPYQTSSTLLHVHDYVYIGLGGDSSSSPLFSRFMGSANPHMAGPSHILVAILFLAIHEVALHLPLLWVKENPFYPNVGVFWFSAFSVAAVFIYAFIFNKTKGSLLIVTLLHAS